MAASTILKIDLNLTYGAYTIGTLVSTLLLGIIFAQVVRYFRKYSDRLVTRLTVVSLLICEVAHSVFAIHTLYNAVIINYANPAQLRFMPWSCSINLAVIGLTSLIVHLSYAMRIYYVSARQLLLPIILVILEVIVFAVVIALAILMSRAADLSTLSLTGTPEDLIRVNLSAAVFIDITIAGSLSYYFYTRRTGIQRTDKLLNRLMVYAINNGILTCICSIACLISAITHPHDLIFLGIVQIVGDIHTNSLLATFNSRPRKKGGDDMDMKTINLNSALNFASRSGAIAFTGPITSMDSRRVCVKKRDTPSPSAPDIEAVDRSARPSHSGW